MRRTETGGGAGAGAGVGACLVREESEDDREEERPSEGEGGDCNAEEVAGPAPFAVRVVPDGRGLKTGGVPERERRGLTALDVCDGGVGAKGDDDGDDDDDDDDADVVVVASATAAGSLKEISKTARRMAGETRA